ncbi:hypothetical protein BPOR_1402g00020 [Botrytis porri]|uniref:Uncharacterized protein n=1 Tax=Botrytis porri TaxID=87229 RepID=A0A4Z1K555_9HELO|nr:hypothetical protein BPOR_1402g00020 [Botrytis porri]
MAPIRIPILDSRSTYPKGLRNVAGSRLTSQNNTPIPIGKVAKNALVTTFTLGLAGRFFARHSADSRSPVTNAGRGTL